MIEIIYRSTKDKEIQELDEFRVGSWINIKNPTEEEIEQVSELISLKFYDLQDSLDLYEIPRMEAHKEAILFFLRTPNLNKKSLLHTEAVTIIVSNEYFITISPKESSLIENAIVRDIIPTTQRAKLLIFLFREIVDSYTNNIRQVTHNVLKHKRDVKDITNKEILLLTQNEDTLNQYLAALIPIENVFERVMNKNYINFYEEDKEFLFDVFTAIKQSVNICKVNLKNIGNFRNSCQTIFSNRLNKTMQFMTAATIIMTVPTIIASIYGMNLFLPLSAHPNSFWILIGISILISLMIYIYFKFRRWI
ncbi:hypothetical protein GF362_01995 [Candidatus Dojkabacteria bacterium]|nr:hypothetical protein [Candidatus Dojkabacteria bacterium]